MGATISILSNKVQKISFQKIIFYENIKRTKKGPIVLYIK